MRRLVLVYADSIYHMPVFKGDTQAGLGLRWSHISYARFPFGRRCVDWTGFILVRYINRAFSI